MSTMVMTTNNLSSHLCHHLFLNLHLFRGGSLRWSLSFYHIHTVSDIHTISCPVQPQCDLLATEQLHRSGWGPVPCSRATSSVAKLSLILVCLYVRISVNPVSHTNTSNIVLILDFMFFFACEGVFTEVNDMQRISFLHLTAHTRRIIVHKTNWALRSNFFPPCDSDLELTLLFPFVAICQPSHVQWELKHTWHFKYCYATKSYIIQIRRRGEHAVVYHKSEILLSLPRVKTILWHYWK